MISPPSCVFTSCFLLLALLSCVFVSLSAASESKCISQVAPLVNTIAIKHHEMLDPVVRIRTRNTTGSGTIYEKIETETEGVFEYRVLTNEHLTRTRMIFSWDADFLIGKLITIPIDTGCNIAVFDPEDQTKQQYAAKVVAEDHSLDLAILSFETDRIITIARIATKEMVENIQVFDEVFAVGCQLGMRPMPTFGIISHITSEDTNKIKRIIYGTTSQITYGSSGGGLFKEYDGHYYLIGITFRVSILNNAQLVPHLAEAISISAVKNLIHENAVILP